MRRNKIPKDIDIIHVVMIQGNDEMLKFLLSRFMI